MLAIGRALMSDPKLILLDEPSLGLAPRFVEHIFGAVRRLKEERGMTVLLVEQNAALALDIADDGYVMENGRIVLDGTAAEPAAEFRRPRVLSRPQRARHPALLSRREALSPPQALARLSARYGQTPISRALPVAALDPYAQNPTMHSGERRSFVCADLLGLAAR